MKQLILIGLLMISSVVPVQAQRQNVRIRFDFRGMRLGDERPERHDNYTCAPIQGETTDRTCQESDVIAGVPVEISYLYVDDRLGELAITFPSDQYEQILATFTAKYRKPHKSGTMPLQNRLGATYRNEMALWYTDSGKLTITRYAGKLDQGMLLIASPSYLRILETRKRDAVKRAAKEKV